MSEEDDKNKKKFRAIDWERVMNIPDEVLRKIEEKRLNSLPSEEECENLRINT